MFKTNRDRQSEQVHIFLDFRFFSLSLSFSLYLFKKKTFCCQTKNAHIVLLLEVSLCFSPPNTSKTFDSEYKRNISIQQAEVIC